MGFLEWIGESYDPGESGSVQIGRGQPPMRSTGGVIISFIISVAALLALYLGLFFGVPEIGWKGWLIIAVVSVAYLLTAYWIRPRPAMENIGWLGGFFDHPFRYSDDLNRFALFMMILLYPGQFIGESLVDMLGLLMGRKSPPRRRRLGRRPKERLKEWEPGSGGAP